MSVITAPTVTCAINAEPANLDFEEGVIGEVPTGWFAQPPEQSGYAVELSGRVGNHHDGPRICPQWRPTGSTDCE